MHLKTGDGGKNRLFFFSFAWNVLQFFKAFVKKKYNIDIRRKMMMILTVSEKSASQDVIESALRSFRKPIGA